MKTARFGGRVNGLWEIEPGFQITNYLQCPRCADYVFVGKSGEVHKIYQTHMSTCTGKLCHGCQDTFGSVESYNDHLSICARNHNVEVLVKEMDPTVSKKVSVCMK